ncbi:MAG: hypothetical protein LBD84_03585 [Campylobacteraceae bacterium]|jgi:hypothetical protein|nr:hypothetical protein [Campylobacteraceae bacterium]
MSKDSITMNEDIEYLKLNGDFSNGTRGIFKTLNGPESSFNLINCVKNRSFISLLKPPRYTVDFVHELINENICPTSYLAKTNESGQVLP